jgi:hypothetical protein
VRRGAYFPLPVVETSACATGPIHQLRSGQSLGLLRRRRPTPVGHWWLVGHGGHRGAAWGPPGPKPPALVGASRLQAGLAPPGPRPPASSTEHRASSIQHRASSIIEHRASGIEHRASGIEPGGGDQRPGASARWPCWAGPPLRAAGCGRACVICDIYDIIIYVIYMTSVGGMRCTTNHERALGLGQRNELLELPALARPT